MPLPRRLSRFGNKFSASRFLDLAVRDIQARQAKEFRVETTRVRAAREAEGYPPLTDMPRPLPSTELMALDPIDGYTREVWDEDEKIKKELQRIAQSSHRMPPRPNPPNRPPTIREHATHSEDSAAPAPPGFALPKLGPLARTITVREVSIGYRRDEQDFAFFDWIAGPILPADLILVCSIIKGDVSAGIIFNHRGKLYTALGEHFTIYQIASPETEQEIIGILKKYTYPEAREKELIVLMLDGLFVMFEDVLRQRWVSLLDLHHWAIWTDGGWDEQMCGCNYCVREAEEEAEKEAEKDAAAGQS